mgnify:FL=1|jgi:hypothetical protein
MLLTASLSCRRGAESEFVQTSLYSLLRDLVTEWSNPENENHGSAAQYKLRNLVTECVTWIPTR